MKTTTELIHAGAPDPEWVGPLTPPIYETTTFVFANAAEVVAYNEGRSSKYLYSRYGNPTLSSVERQVAALDRAEAALVFSSGMGAITTILMAHARAGEPPDDRWRCAGAEGRGAHPELAFQRFAEARGPHAFEQVAGDDGDRLREIAGRLPLRRGGDDDLLRFCLRLRGNRIQNERDGERK